MDKQRREMLRDHILQSEFARPSRREVIELLDYIDKLERFAEEVEHEEQIRTR